MHVRKQPFKLSQIVCRATTISTFLNSDLGLISCTNIVYNVYEMLILLNSEDQADYRTAVTKQIDILFSDALIETSVPKKAKHDGRYEIIC